ncbi:MULTISPECIES: cell wall hydrolase [unclassified Sphingomonas]|uniref:cell wall hydrolase n=1 Tax=unclassified Sphingomonas TaxID=196159 RepID=UPI000FECE4AD|nr:MULTISPECIES: cell wall hydrolase [unclassified Sphingomonas]RKE54029.1 cell wall hydrolase [Sphingomonas sp. PP-CC-1A-547]TCM10572.1 cell wall hydrolase [Sphingomonas sp. PP-CC-3G-468]
MALLDLIRRQAPASHEPAPSTLILDPNTVSSLPPVRRFHLGVIVPALLALILIGGSIIVAVVSLGTPPDKTFDATGGTRWASTARIEAPFAPKTMRPLTPEQAVAWNAAAPTVAKRVESASTFALRTGKAEDYSRSLQCLTMAVYYEAGSESDDGERAVAQVILNRVRHPAYPKTVCGVVLDGSQRRTGCQFTFVCDGALGRLPSQKGWLRASRIATSALGGAVFAPVGWATHYHANYVVPYWASSLEKVAAIGAHIFYRWNGPAGRGGAFRGVYAGNEPAMTLPAAVVTPTATDATATVATASGAVAPSERPVLNGYRASLPDDSPVPTVSLGERRVLPRGPEVGDGSALPPTPERRVLPISPTVN